MDKLENLLELLSNKIIKGASAERFAGEENKEFKVLVSTILSTRTRDETTEKVSERLFKRIKNVNDLDELPERELEKLIYPVGFYKNKTKNLKKLARELKRRDIPKEMEELLKLPGVGKKVANIVLNSGFKKEGLAVDTHVHRICNRYGYVNTELPGETEKNLREKLPKKYWKSINQLLVVFGKKICSVVPRCEICYEGIKEICPYFDKLNFFDKTLERYNFYKISKSNLKKEKGTYILRIRLDPGKKIRENFYRRGFYFYVGSALGDSINLKTRIERHLSREKKKRWHIDYLLEHGKIDKIFVSKEKAEHKIAKELGKKLDSIKDFGSSDCSCRSHLFFMKF